MSSKAKSMAALSLLMWTAACALALSSCTTMLEPQGFEQRLAYAYSTHTAVMQAATSSVDADDLTLEQAQAVMRLADDSKVLLDAARVAAVGNDLTNAERQLVLATDLLNRLREHLRAKGPQP